MATLHREFTDGFHEKIKLSSKKEQLLTSRNSIQKQIEDYFEDKKTDELQPIFIGQGSFEMDTINNPIPVKNENGKTLYKYDLDYGVYFIEKKDEDNKKKIDTWHSWVFNAVDNHTNTPSNDKTTCVRVNFADGHHIDLPIYYVKDEKVQLGHKSKGWIDSNPPEFTEWFRKIADKKPQLRRIVRYLKAWKNYREEKNTNLKFPSGFALTILATNHFKENDRDDISLQDTIKSIHTQLSEKDNFKCLRPTTPKDEDIFEDFSKTRKDDFLTNLNNLINDSQKAINEVNFKTASEYLQKHFGDRFPLGKDEDDKSSIASLSSTLESALFRPKPFANGWV